MKTPNRGPETDLYRPEALAAHRAGGRVRKRSRWLDAGAADGGRAGRLAFSGLLAVALTASATALFVPVTDAVRGDAVVRLEPRAGQPGAVETRLDILIEAQMPAARRSDLTVGQAMRMTLPGPAETELRARIVDISDAPGDLAPMAAPGAVVVTARVEGSPPPGYAELRDGMRGQARVHVASTSLLAHLVPSAGHPSEGSR
ncbi:MAG: hypothetical protein AAFX50_23740 [Acidobacteriota bacterium]